MLDHTENSDELKMFYYFGYDWKDILSGQRFEQTYSIPTNSQRGAHLRIIIRCGIS
jgi:hypothetical protein